MKDPALSSLETRKKAHLKWYATNKENAAKSKVSSTQRRRARIVLGKKDNGEPVGRVYPEHYVRDEQIFEARRLGATLKQLSTTFGLSIARIWKILNSK